MSTIISFQCFVYQSGNAVCKCAPEIGNDDEFRSKDHRRSFALHAIYSFLNDSFHENTNTLNTFYAPMSQMDRKAMACFNLKYTNLLLLF